MSGATTLALALRWGQPLLGSHFTQLPQPEFPPFGRHQIAQRIRRVIALNSFFIRIHLEHILGSVRIVLQ